MLIPIDASENRPSFDTTIDHVIPPTLDIKSRRTSHPSTFQYQWRNCQSICCLLRRDPVSSAYFDLQFFMPYAHRSESFGLSRQRGYPRRRGADGEHSLF